MRAVILLAHSWPREHPPSCLCFLLRMQSQRSTQTSLQALLLPDIAQEGTWSQPNFTFRGDMKDTFLLKHRSCSSQPYSFWETKLRYVYHHAAVPVTPSGRMGGCAAISNPQGSLPSPLSGLYPDRWSLAGLQSTDNPKAKYLQKLNVPNITNFT